MNRKHIVISGLLAGLSLIAVAQTPPAPAPAAAAGAKAEQPGRFDSARFREHMAARQAALKEKLKITAAQEAAWNTWTAAMQPPADLKRPDPAEFDKLTTPERIDRMHALRAERMARMDKRGEATKTFYAALNAEQKKVFDAETLHFARGRGERGWGPHGWHHRG